MKLKKVEFIRNIWINKLILTDNFKNMAQFRALTFLPQNTSSNQQSFEFKPIKWVNISHDQMLQNRSTTSTYSTKNCIVNLGLLRTMYNKHYLFLSEVSCVMAPT